MMRLPDQLQQRSFTEWNHIVRGLMEVWELAQLLGVEPYLEEQLAADEDGRLSDLLGKLGNDCWTLADALRVHTHATLIQARLQALLAEARAQPRDAEAALALVCCGLPASGLQTRPPG